MNKRSLAVGENNSISGKRPMTPARAKKIAANSFVHVILSILSIIWMAPIAWVVLISFKSEKGMYMKTLLPKSYTLDNYKKLFLDRGVLDFPQMFMNTLIIAIFTCVISTFFVLSVSYCMSRMRFSSNFYVLIFHEAKDELWDATPSVSVHFILEVSRPPSATF